MQDGKLSTLFLCRNLDILDVFPRILNFNSRCYYDIVGMKGSLEN